MHQKYFVFIFVTRYKSCRNPTLKECEDDTHTPEMGLGNPPGLLKTQNLIAGVKTPRLDVFFILLERS
jgi:hypothetical protein